MLVELISVVDQVPSYILLFPSIVGAKSSRWDNQLSFLLCPQQLLFHRSTSGINERPLLHNEHHIEPAQQFNPELNIVH